MTGSDPGRPVSAAPGGTETPTGRQQLRATISGQSEIYVILGDPIAQVRTPALTNTHFDRIGLDAVLVPLRVAPADLARALDGLRVMRNLAGIVVTVPHKESIAALCDDLTEEARRVGAANVIRREADGSLIGGQFDGEGFCAGLRAAGHSVAGKRIFLAGAGGAAAGITFALARHGAARITLHNRTTAKAEALAARVRAAWPACEIGVGDANPAGHDWAINATSLGMREEDALPMDVAHLAPPMLAAEVIMRPAVTRFLAEATRRGCATHGGEPMLLEQVGMLVDFMREERRGSSP